MNLYCQLVSACDREYKNGHLNNHWTFITAELNCTWTNWLTLSFSPQGLSRSTTIALNGMIHVVYWARHFTLTVPLSTQVYKWVPVNLMLGLTLWWTSIPSRGRVEILLVTSCYRNQDKLCLMGHYWLVCRLYLTHTTCTCILWGCLPLAKSLIILVERQMEQTFSRKFIWYSYFSV